MNDNTYLHIDMEKTGLMLKKKITEQGYTVKDIQKHLQLSCPQPVYRWLKGKVLPSLDHMLMLSHILKVHMEDLLVVEDIGMHSEEQQPNKWFPFDAQETDQCLAVPPMLPENMHKRMSAYWQALCDGAA